MLSDPFDDKPAELEHMVEKIDTSHRFLLLSSRIMGSQTEADDAFVTGHGRFDQGSPIVV